jgi:hypothetical protein
MWSWLLLVVVARRTVAMWSWLLLVVVVSRTRWQKI